MGEMLYTQEALDEVNDEVRVLRDELSHIADALGVAPYGGCYEQAEVLDRAKALAKRVEEQSRLEDSLADWHVARDRYRDAQWNPFEISPQEANKRAHIESAARGRMNAAVTVLEDLAQAIAERRAGRAK